MAVRSVIIRPIITEKSMHEADNGKFTFEVAKDADKTMIKKAIEKQFSVTVTGLSTNLVKGKRKRIGMRRMEVKDSPWKKATATLKAGQKIDMFDLTGETEEQK